MSVSNPWSLKARIEAPARLPASGCGGSRGPPDRSAMTSSGRADGTRIPGTTRSWRVARRQGRILVTLDKDFGELAIVMGPAALRARENRWLRRPGNRPRVIQQVLSSHGSANCMLGAVVTATSGPTGRIRPPRYESGAGRSRLKRTLRSHDNGKIRCPLFPRSFLWRRVLVGRRPRSSPTFAQRLQRSPMDREKSPGSLPEFS